MSVTATTIGDWELADLDCQARLTLTDGGLYKVAHHTLTKRRKNVGVTAFDNEEGNFEVTINLDEGLYTGGDDKITLGEMGWDMKWMCTRHHLGPIDQVTGECIEEQIWETYSEPELIEWDEFLDAGGS